MSEVSLAIYATTQRQFYVAFEAGERLRVTVSRRPVAQLGPVERAAWVSGAAMERILREAPADSGLLDDFVPLREQTIEPR